MPLKEPSFTIGIEEEYLLVDRETRALASEPPPEMLEACENIVKDLVRPEFLKAQIEIGTTVCKTVPEAHDQLAHLRRSVAKVADDFNLAPIAASTHPFPPGPIRSTQTRNATTNWQIRCKASHGVCLSAACTFTSASTTMTSASIF